ncbi:MAG: hypothetical protein R3F34_10550 [Planctomycetota bacterium]
MGTRSNTLARLLTVALAAAPLLASSGDGAQDRYADRAHTPTELSDARRLPSRTVERPFRFAITVRAVDRPYDALLTKFDRGHWLRVEAWSDDAFLWDEDAFEDPAPYLFARRGTAVAERLAGAKPYERLMVEGAVRQVFAGEPWIEIWSVRSAEPSITEATVFHAARAISLRRKGQDELARSEMDSALAAPMPERQREALEALRAEWGETVVR